MSRDASYMLRIPVQYGGQFAERRIYFCWWLWRFRKDSGIMARGLDDGGVCQPILASNIVSVNYN